MINMFNQTIYKTINKDILLEAYTRLHSLEKIAKEMNVSWKVIKKAMMYNGLFYSRPHVSFDKELVLKEYKLTGSIMAVAKNLNIDHAQLQYFFKREGLEYKKHNKYIYDHDFFTRKNEKTYYWAGFLIADGNVINDQTLRIELSEHDKDHLQKFATLLSSNKKISSRINNGGHSCVGFSIHSKKIVNNVKQLFNIIPAKSLIYTLPEYLILDPLVKHLIRGIIDGDGCFYVSGLTQKEITKTKINPKDHIMKLKICGTKDLLNKIHTVFYNNKLVDSINHSVSILENLNYIVYTGSCLKNIIKYLYEDSSIFLERKFEIAKLIDNVIDDSKTIRHSKWYIEENLTKEALEKDYIQNNNMNELARKYGVSNVTVKTYLKKFEIIN